MPLSKRMISFMVFSPLLFAETPAPKPSPVVKEPIVLFSPQKSATIDPVTGDVVLEKDVDPKHLIKLMYGDITSLQAQLRECRKSPTLSGNVKKK